MAGQPAPQETEMIRLRCGAPNKYVTVECPAENLTMDRFWMQFDSDGYVWLCMKDLYRSQGQYCSESPCRKVHILPGKGQEVRRLVRAAETGERKAQVRPQRQSPPPEHHAAAAGSDRSASGSMRAPPPAAAAAGAEGRRGSQAGGLQARREEHEPFRIDERDGMAYSQRDFLEEYGAELGMDLWESSVVYNPLAEPGSAAFGHTAAPFLPPAPLPTPEQFPAGAAPAAPPAQASAGSHQRGSPQSGTELPPLRSASSAQSGLELPALRSASPASSRASPWQPAPSSSPHSPQADAAEPPALAAPGSAQQLSLNGSATPGDAGGGGGGGHLAVVHGMVVHDDEKQAQSALEQAGWVAGSRGGGTSATAEAPPPTRTSAAAPARRADPQAAAADWRVRLRDALLEQRVIPPRAEEVIDAVASLGVNALDDLREVLQVFPVDAGSEIRADFHDVKSELDKHMRQHRCELLKLLELRKLGRFGRQLQD
eukprot:TRINITY_DN3764_c0_g1_i2.p1 TRINITY_DN3764_c0_g1~~TRINITY_DN3764_c0_g1_i2.p1  ORF type:complete len:517 (+),score=88.87 TRINITY_DN3764_c0_g1_i2:99-1553(+)